MNTTESMLRQLCLDDIAEIVNREVAAARIHKVHWQRIAWLSRGIFARIARHWTDASWPEIARKANVYWDIANEDNHSTFIVASIKGTWTFGRFSPETVFEITTRCEAAVITGTIGPCHAQPLKPAAKGPDPCKTQDLAPKDRIRENRRTRAGSTPARGVAPLPPSGCSESPKASRGSARASGAATPPSTTRERRTAGRSASASPVAPASQTSQSSVLSPVRLRS